MLLWGSDVRSDMVFVVSMCFMFVLIFASSMVLGFVLISVV